MNKYNLAITFSFTFAVQNRFLNPLYFTIMKLQQLAEALDAQILKGDIVGAFATYAADNCVTLSNAQDVTNSKAQKLEILQWFFHNIAATNRIERLAFEVGDNTTDSQFVFEFTNKQGETLAYSEVIRRTWKAGKVVEEQYLLDQTLAAAKKAAPKKAAAIKPSKKEAAQDIQPAAAKAVAVKEPKAAKPAAKTAKTAKATAAPKAAQKPTAKSDKPKAGRK